MAGPPRLPLAGDHGAEVGPRAEQVAVRPDRGHPAVAEEDDLVDGVQHQGAGADHDRGASGPVVAQPRGDPGLGVGVDGRGRLDEHEDLRVGGEDAGQDQPLPLAAGERAAALGDDRVHAVGERLEDVLGRGGGEGVVDRAGARHVEAVASRPENSVEPVSETTMRRRTSARGAHSAGRRPASPRRRRPRRTAQPVGQRRGLVGPVADDGRDRAGPDDQAGTRVGEHGAGGGASSGCSARRGRASGRARGRHGRGATRPRMTLLAYSVAVRSGIIRNAE